MERTRCHWCNVKNPVYIKYHDEEWGVPLHDDLQLFELLMLEIFQAGLSWETVLNKRENFRMAFDGWEPESICHYSDGKIQALLTEPGIYGILQMAHRSARRIEPIPSCQISFPQISENGV